MARQSTGEKKQRSTDAAAEQRDVARGAKSPAIALAGMAKGGKKPYPTAPFNQNVRYFYNHRNAELQSGLMAK